MRLQRIILRLLATSTLAALPAIFVPHLAIQKIAWLIGSQETPPSPLLVYMLAGGSAVYVAQGVLLWMISADPVRHRPLIVTLAWTLVLLAPAFVWIHLQATTPRWWLLLDSGSCLAGGLALLSSLRSRAR